MSTRPKRVPKPRKFKTRREARSAALKWARKFMPEYEPPDDLEVNAWEEQARDYQHGYGGTFKTANHTGEWPADDNE
jgi:hypothetical protein